MSETRDDLVPGWLALLVLVLLLAVFALGGWIVRGMVAEKRSVDPAAVAVASWKAKVAGDGSNTQYRLSYGFALQQDKQYAKALAQYRVVLAEEPKNTAALYNEGVIYSQTGQPKLAEITWWKVLDIAPDHVLSAKALGQYYIGKHQYKSALVALKPAVKAQPQYADLQYLEGQCLERLDLDAAAIQHYRLAVRYAPDLTDARDALTRLGVK